MMSPLLKALQGRLIVSCQASDGDAFRDSSSIARFAQAAVQGGAAGIRANSPEDVAAIRAAVSVPIIGIDKQLQSDGRVLITPSFESARQLSAAGAEMIALDCTPRGQASGAFDHIKRIHNELGALALADISTVKEAIAAIEAGADAVLSTLRGYTDHTAHVTNFEPSFIQALAELTDVPIIAEGRIHSPAQAKMAMDAGAFAVIVGTAITRPADITAAFASAVHEAYARRTTRFFVGVDLGGTNIKYGLVSSQGNLLWHSVLPTPAHEGKQALLAALTTAVSCALQEADERSLTVASVGIATAGWVDTRTGTIAYATENLPGWTGTPVAEHVAASCRLTVAVENDANALAVAEKHFGAGQGFDHFIVITLGTGVGGGCYINGRLNRGAHFFANAFGHIPLIPDGLPCTCGRRGCLETYTNAAALLRYAGPSFTSVQQIINAANSGDFAASEAVRQLARHLARGCASIVGLLDPQALILSGGLATDNPLLIQFLRTELAPLVPSWDRRNLNISASRLGYFGSIFGAAALGAEPTRTE